MTLFSNRTFNYRENYHNWNMLGYCGLRAIELITEGGLNITQSDA